MCARVLVSLVDIIYLFTLYYTVLETLAYSFPTALFQRMRTAAELIPSHDLSRIHGGHLCVKSVNLGGRRRRLLAAARTHR